jgi:hypothetical protein
MAIVGTAYVRLRVIGDKLKGDITNATKKAVNDSAPDLKQSGEDTGGEHVAEGMGNRTVEKDPATRWSASATTSATPSATRWATRSGRSLRNRIGTAPSATGSHRGRTELNKAQDFFKPVSDKFEKFFGDKSKHFEGVFKNALMSGISLAVHRLTLRAGLPGRRYRGLWRPQPSQPCPR